MLKQLHKFYSRADVPWVKLVWSLYGNDVPHAKSRRGSFWWPDIFSLVEDYRSVSSCQVGSGTSVLFWKDFWLEGGLLCDKFPRLFSYALDEDLSVSVLASAEDLSAYFALPMSVEAYQEFQTVSQILASTQLVENAADQRIFVWGNNYTPSSFYKFISAHLPRDPALNAIRKSKSMPKLKVFCWLLFIDRLNTRDLMLRKHWHLETGPECVLCQSATIESRDHLFFDCDFASHCWEFLHIPWDVSLPITNRFIAARDLFQGPNFMMVFACAAWNIWKSRNDLIFNQVQASFNRWKVGFQKDLLLHRFRVKQVDIQPLVDWLSSVCV